MVASDTMLGIGLALIGTFLSACGYTFQKVAHNLVDKEAEELEAKERELRARVDAKASGRASPDAEEPSRARGATEVELDEVKAGPRNYWKRWQFPFGLALLVAGSVFAVFVFGLAGQSELAPMGAVTMIYNTILAWRFLGEPFTTVDAVSTSLMAIGTTTAVVFAESSDTEYNLDDILHLLDRSVVWYFVAGQFLTIFMSVGYIYTIGKREREGMSRVQQMLDAFSRSYLGGVFSGYTGFLTKSIVEIFFNSVAESDGSDWGRFETYMFVIGLAASLFFQLKFFNMGLQKYDSMQIVRIYQSCIVLFAVMSGYVFFDEIAVQTDLSITLFIIGVFVTTCGILVGLLRKQAASATPPEETEFSSLNVDTTKAPSYGGPSGSPSGSPTAKSPRVSPDLPGTELAPESGPAAAPAAACADPEGDATVEVAV